MPGLVAALLCLGAAACEKNDIGRPCPQLTEGTDESGDDQQSDETRTQTQEVVGQSTSFPCDEFICIATQGRSGYCSKKCRDDAGCPAGFSCRVIMGIGEFANESFCAWKECNATADCGNKEELCCRQVEGAEPVSGQQGEELKLCDFADNGKCG